MVNDVKLKNSICPNARHAARSLQSQMYSLTQCKRFSGVSHSAAFNSKSETHSDSTDSDTHSLADGNLCINKQFRDKREDYSRVIVALHLIKLLVYY